MLQKVLLIAFALTQFGLALELSVLDRYTTLRTIAGMGNLEDGNFWQTAYEGSHPRLVELSNPHHCGTDAYGRVYIVDKESHSVLRVSADGSTIITVAGTHIAGNAGDESITATSGALQNPNGLFVFPNGRFFVLDTDNRKVRCIDPNGIMTTLFHYPAGFGAGRGLVASPLGDEVYFCGELVSPTQQLVKKWSAHQGFTTVATINPGVQGLGNLDLGPNGTLYVTSVGDHRVYRITQNGNPIVVAGNGMTDGNLTSGSLATTVALNRVRAVAVLPDDSFFLATQKGGDVWWVDNGAAHDGLNRRIHLFVNGAGSGNIKLGDDQSRLGETDRIAEPRAIHLATNGDLLITCNDTGVIRAVRNICRPKAPMLHYQHPILSWDSQWGDRFIIEESNTMAAGSWTSQSGVTTAVTGRQSLRLSEQSSRFFRLYVSHLAGGQ